MKNFISAALVALMLFPTMSLSVLSVSAQEVAQVKLTNKNVIQMAKAKMSEAIILAKISSSPTNFDTSPDALEGLKKAGVSDAVMLAMVQAGNSIPAQPISPQLVPAQPIPVAENLNLGAVSSNSAGTVIPDGTEIEIELKNTLSGQELKLGDVVYFTVVRPVEVNGVTVIEQGASAKANITRAKKAGSWGKTGKLDWALRDVQTVTGERIPVRFTKATVGGSEGGTVAVATIATVALLGPLGFLWGFKKGKKAEIPAGSRYSIFTDGKSTIKLISPIQAMSQDFSAIPSSGQSKYTIIKPNMKGNGYNQGGFISFSQKKYGEAEKSFREAIRVDPSNLLYRHNLAVALNAQSKFDEAEKEIEIAVPFAPNNATYKRNLEIIRSNKSSGTFYIFQPQL